MAVFETGIRLHFQLANYFNSTVTERNSSEGVLCTAPAKTYDQNTRPEKWNFWNLSNALENWQIGGSYGNTNGYSSILGFYAVSTGIYRRFRKSIMSTTPKRLSVFTGWHRITFKKTNKNIHYVYQQCTHCMYTLRTNCMYEMCTNCMYELHTNCTYELCTTCMYEMCTNYVRNVYKIFFDFVNIFGYTA